MWPRASAEERSLSLSGDPSSSARCRAFLRSTLEDWQLPGSLDDVLLLTSELCSNAVVHARTDMVVRVTWDPVDQVLRVSVRDGSRQLPTVRPQSYLAPSGRGLWLISTVASRWGVEPLPTGKDVWFEVVAGAGFPATRP